MFGAVKSKVVVGFRGFTQHLLALRAKWVTDQLY